MHHTLARSGTPLFTMVSLLALGACSDSHDVTVLVVDGGVDARVPDAQMDAQIDASVDGSAPPVHSDAGSECQTTQDCELVPASCCPCRPAQVSQFRAQKRAPGDPLGGLTVDCVDVECAGCPYIPPQPYDPAVRADCVDNRCQVVDVRTQARSHCSFGEQCVARALFCETATDDLSTWVGISDVNAEAISCPPQGDGAPAPVTPPLAFCGFDGHCAVRHPDTLDGVASTTCFSPYQNMASAQDAGVPSCDCSLGDEACIGVSQFFFFQCAQARWQNRGNPCIFP